MKSKNDVIALIPTRLNSTRLPAKALLPINNLPLIMHVYKRTLLAKNVNEVIICCSNHPGNWISLTFDVKTAKERVARRWESLKLSIDLHQRELSVFQVEYQLKNLHP